MQSAWYNETYESLDVVSGVERGRGQRQHDWHVTAWRLETGRTLGSIPPAPYEIRQENYE